MKGIPGPPALSKPWKALRKFDPDRRERPIVFGATAAAAACGLSPYKTPLELYMDALGLTNELEDNDAMRMGRALEPVVLDEFERRRGKKLRRGLPMFFHEEHNFMAATPDGVTLEETEEAEEGVDAKTSTFRRLDKDGDDPLKFGLEGTDQMPVDYVMQGQQQIAVLGVPAVEFPVLFDGRTMKIYRVERNDDLIGAIVNAERELLERLKNNDPPEPNWTHENTRELIGLLFGAQKGLRWPASDEQVARWEAVKRRKARIKALEERNDADLNHIRWEMKEAAALSLPGERLIKRIAIKETVVPEHTRAGYEYLREGKG